MWSFSFGSGTFLGSAAGGFMVEHLGFSSASMSFALLYLAVTGADAASLLCLNCRKVEANEETQRLLLDRPQK